MKNKPITTDIVMNFRTTEQRDAFVTELGASWSKSITMTVGGEQIISNVDGMHITARFRTPCVIFNASEPAFVKKQLKKLKP